MRFIYPVSFPHRSGSMNEIGPLSVLVLRKFRRTAVPGLAICGHDLACQWQSSDLMTAHGPWQIAPESLRPKIASLTLSNKCILARGYFSGVTSMDEFDDRKIAVNASSPIPPELT